MKHMNLKTMSTPELKALAYDQLVLLNTVQANVNLIEQELQLRTQAEQEIPQKPVTKKK